MDTTEVQQALHDIGWPIRVDGTPGAETRGAVAAFQLGFTFAELVPDGVPGPLTQAALVDCIDNPDGRRPGACAEFFDFAEFASKGNGWIKVHPRLLNRLDALRRSVGHPLAVISGYRDPAHNTEIGGKPNSQHLYGTACDVETGLALQGLTDLGFSGIGLAAGLGVHVDVRAEGPSNTTGASVGNPTVWHYS